MPAAWSASRLGSCAGAVFLGQVLRISASARACERSTEVAGAWEAWQLWGIQDCKSHRQSNTVKGQHARGHGRACNLTVFWAFTQVIQNVTAGLCQSPPSPPSSPHSPHSHTLRLLVCHGQPTTAHLQLSPGSIHATVAIVKLSKSNFFLLPLAFAGDRPCACSRSLLTRLRPQGPPSTVA